MATTQTLILAGSSGESRFYPITDGSSPKEAIPKALLPVGNRPMITYLLHTLSKCGCTENVFVVTTSPFESVVCAALIEYPWVEVIVVNELSTVGALKAVVSQKALDVLVLSGECCLGRDTLTKLVEEHRLRQPDCTMLLRRGQSEEGDIFVVADDLVFDKINRYDLDDEAGGEGKLRIPKALLARCRRVKASADLVDLHAYVFHAEALRCSLARFSDDDTSSVKTDLIPALAKSFFTQQQDERKGVAALVVDGAAQQRPKQQKNATAAEDDDEDPLGSDVAERIRTIQAYATLCRHVVSRGGRNVSLKPIGTVSKRDSSLVGTEVATGEKTQLKNSSVGSRVKIGNRCKINNSIIMDDVVVEDGAVIQNSVVCNFAEVGAKCNLNSVQVGHRARLAPNTQLKQETFTVLDDEDHESEELLLASG